MDNNMIIKANLTDYTERKRVIWYEVEKSYYIYHHHMQSIMECLRIKEYTTNTNLNMLCFTCIIHMYWLKVNMSKCLNLKERGLQKKKSQF